MPIDSGELYDRVPYEGAAFPSSHPNSLAVVASLVGFVPVRPDRCRVLEVGCSVGNNLLPIAAAYPHSEFIGFDASAVQIKSGREFLATTGLTNVELRHMSIMDIPPSLGVFDYIICHGVWSVVPPPVREKIFQVARDFLSPNGLAYISYNTLPGWRWKGALRDMLRMHASYHVQADAKVKAARKFLALLADSFPKSDENPFAAFIRKQNGDLEAAPDAYMFHEFLADINEPVYFKDFIGRAQEAGLKYVAESNPGNSMESLLQKPLADALAALPIDRIEREQHVDFVNNRSFRGTILCRADAASRDRVSAEALPSLLVACAAKPKNPAADFLREGSPEVFITPAIGSVAPADAMSKVAFAHLSAIHPQAISFPGLVDVVSKKLAAANIPVTAKKENELASMLLDGYLRRFVELHYQVPQVVSSVSAKPVAWAIARAQARAGKAVTNTRHSPINLPALGCFVLTLLDGTNDLDALATAVNERIKKGEFAIAMKQPGFAFSGEDQKNFVTTQVEQILGDFCRRALLVG